MELNLVVLLGLALAMISVLSLIIERLFFPSILAFISGIMLSGLHDIRPLKRLTVPVRDLLLPIFSYHLGYRSTSNKESSLTHCSLS